MPFGSIMGTPESMYEVCVELDKKKKDQNKKGRRESGLVTPPPPPGSGQARILASETVRDYGCLDESIMVTNDEEDWLGGAFRCNTKKQVSRR